jgi:hypothetical protein
MLVHVDQCRGRKGQAKGQAMQIVETFSTIMVLFFLMATIIGVVSATP